MGGSFSHVTVFVVGFVEAFLSQFAGSGFSISIALINVPWICPSNALVVRLAVAIGERADVDQGSFNCRVWFLISNGCQLRDQARDVDMPTILRFIRQVKADVNQEAYPAPIQVTGEGDGQ